MKNPRLAVWLGGVVWYIKSAYILLHKSYFGDTCHTTLCTSNIYSHIIIVNSSPGVIDVPYKYIGRATMPCVPTCECKADIKSRWISGDVRVLICERCGKCVPGYERLWLVRERDLERVKLDSS